MKDLDFDIRFNNEIEDGNEKIRSLYNDTVSNKSDFTAFCINRAKASACEWTCRYEIFSFNIKKINHPTSDLKYLGASICHVNFVLE